MKGSVSMIIKITRVGVADGNVALPVGHELEIDEANGKSLIDDGYAEDITPVGPPAGDPSADDMAKALDKKYKADALKEAATAAGVEFAADATKAEVIAAVIAAGKYADLA